MKFYVYELVDPRTDEIFYVGKGKNNRANEHEREARNGVNGPKCDRIREIMEAGERIKINKVKHFEDEQEAYAFERERIEQIGIENLTNIAPGGGASGDPLLDKDVLSIDLTCLILKLKHKKARGRDFKVFINDALLFDTKQRLEELRCEVMDVIARRGQDWVAKKFAARRVIAEFA